MNTSVLFSKLFLRTSFSTHRTMGTSSKKIPEIKLSTIISKKYVAIRLLGKGGYGVVYEIARMNQPSQRLAVKAELASIHNNLNSEWALMKLLQENKSKHNIIGIEIGNERNYNFLIMHLLGPSLADLRRTIPKKKFTLFTTIVCGIQCFDALCELHQIGFIHRDVKPSNFAIGVLGNVEEKLIHVLDFGICRKICGKLGDLRKPRAKVPFRGTTTYCSTNVHLRLEPGRHDDLWSLLYMLIEFHLSDLPWEGRSKDETKKMKETRIEELLEKCPKEFKYLKIHLQGLTYSKAPDYVICRRLLCQLFLKNKFTSEMPLDWQIGGEYASYFSKHLLLKSKKITPVFFKSLELAEILTLPDDRVLLDEKDFPIPEDGTTACHTESTTNSDDTIPYYQAAKKKPSKGKPSSPSPKNAKILTGIMAKLKWKKK